MSRRSIEFPISHASIVHDQYGDSEAASRWLEKPDIMGVVLSNAFSADALACAQKVVSRPGYNTPHRHELPLTPMIAGEAELAPLINNLALVKRMFSAVGSQVVGEPGVRDLSRIEPSISDSFAASARPWHCDQKGKLIGLAVMAGITSDIQPYPLSGAFDRQLVFHPSSPGVAEKKSMRMAHCEFAILKAGQYPFPPGCMERGGVHRRPVTGLGSLARTARMVIHFKIL